jgi:hypothetical protein
MQSWGCKSPRLFLKTMSEIFTMLLTSPRRVRSYLGGEGDALTMASKTNRQIIQWLPAISSLIETHMSRCVLLQSYTEYLDVLYHKLEYWLKAIPISSITSVYSDSRGLWAGGEVQEVDWFTGQDDRSVILQRNLSWTWKKGLRVIYTGGLALHAVNSVYVTSGETGTPTAGQVVRGGTSGAVGYVIAYTSHSLTVEVYYGMFIAGETLSFYADETYSSVISTAVYASATSLSLAETHPRIVLACEMQMRYAIKHMADFENSSTSKDGTTQRVHDPARSILLPEVADILRDYTRDIL